MSDPIAPSITIDASPENERRAKTHNGVYIGTVCGNQAERSEIAAAIAHAMRLIDEHLGTCGRFARVDLSIEIADGRLKIAKSGDEVSFKARA